MSIEAIALGFPAILGISEGMGRNRDNFPIFDTEESDPEKFWDSLNKNTKGKYYEYWKGKRAYHEKNEVGSLAVHQGFMTPNIVWDASNTKFKDLSKRQQRIIKATLKCKDEMYTIISVRAMSGLFRIN